MNIIVDLCANTAAGYIDQGKLVEAIPNLRAAMHFGGNESARVNSIYLASVFAGKAQEAFGRGDLEDAARNAGLSLAVHQNEAALIVLAQIYLGKDPETVADIARQLADIAKIDDPRGLKINALIWRLDALQQIEPRDTPLEESIGRDALAALNHHLDAQPASTGGLMARAMLYRRFGNLQAALKDLRALRAIEPTNIIPAAHCADFTSDARDPECAAALTAIAQLTDDNPQMLSQFYDLARRCGASEIAEGMLRRLAPIDPAFRALAEAKAMMRDQTPDLTLGAARAEGKRHRVFLFGHEEQTTRTLLEIALPMLLAAGNLPALAERGGVTVDISVPASLLARVLSAPILAKIAEICAVEVRGRPSPPPRFERRYFGLAFGAAVERARADSAALIQIPMHAVIADGSLSTLAALDEDGASALFFDPLEVSAAPLLGWLGGGAAGERVSMKALDLSEAVLKHLPPAGRRWIVDADGRIESGAQRMMFAKPDGLSVRSRQCAPVYFGPEALRALGEEITDPPDGYVTDRALMVKEIRTAVVPVTPAFAMAILTDMPGAETRAQPRKATDVLLEQCRALPSTLGRTRLLSMATRWIGLPPARAELTDDAVEDAFAAEVQARLIAI